ncbi:ParB/RepB/Spo0J family partition protein [Aestuariirhabdus sp. Z084]|uniref:ParB/RepB/Spo0J family partition protein n=1 Tax=Aestuariirhabdus haliotis TaxID=2918751 RepID=UPI00201B3A49|nr:ParB/RepB/Spo0J family partition protein [Aestuariirhabdus haliotis]MCL6414230.1 ParB/RepB/Spo0J family partition protein [Aestuariirhabdus haliotis]MCL6418162.1 ParB/RepB/Spo0J family partition protein [Aestuariirhabdus haliotis]
MAAKKRGLGRGLDALLSGSALPDASDGNQSVTDGKLTEIPVEFIQRGKYQPRRDMHPEALEELANSIKVQGVMQPIVVRPIDIDRYEIIAGERRWRATQKAGLDRIPAIVREVPDEAAIAMALIENIQREDLNPIEEAMALQRLQDEFELTQQQVADAVGKSRTTVTNLLRLIGLNAEVRTMLEHGDLEMGHARAMLTLEDDLQMEAARSVVARSLSVRQTEALIRKLQQPASPSTQPEAVNPDIRNLQDSLGERLGASVRIDHSAKGKGKLVIQYNTLDELDGILAHIK